MADKSLSIKVTGARELRKAIKQAEDQDLKGELKGAYREAAQIIVQGSKLRVPHRSGALEGSIRPLGGVTSAIVAAGRASVPYAGPIHFGWPARGIEPQPFIHDTIKDDWRKVYKTFTDAIDNVTRKI